MTDTTPTAKALGQTPQQLIADSIDLAIEADKLFKLGARKAQRVFDLRDQAAKLLRANHCPGISHDHVVRTLSDYGLIAGACIGTMEALMGREHASRAGNSHSLVRAIASSDAAVRSMVSQEGAVNHSDLPPPKAA